MSGGVEINDRVENWAIEPAAASRVRLRRWLSLVIMLVVFGSGAAIGSGLTTISIENNFEKRWQNPAEGRERMLAALRRDLHLSDPQSEEIEQILKTHDNAVMKVWASTRPQMRALFKQLDEQIAGALTTDQQPQWHAWLEKRRSRVCPPPSRSSKHARHHEGRHHEGQHHEGQRPPSHASNDAAGSDAADSNASRPQRPE
ncbi:MAG TPA: hypothetical protein VN699_18235 [Pirellulales bacterium]|nr:hypothetical protein [Pirellulales bacterium]